MTQELELPPLSRVVRDLANHDKSFAVFAAENPDHLPNPVNMDRFGLYGPSAVRYLIVSLLLDTLEDTVQAHLGGPFRLNEDSHYDPILAHQYNKLRGIYLSATVGMHRIFDPTQWDPSGPMVPPVCKDPLEYVSGNADIVNDIMIAHSILQQDTLVMFNEHVGAFQIAVGDKWMDLSYTERLKVTNAGSAYMFERAKGMVEIIHHVLIVDTIMYLYANHNIGDYVDVEGVIADLTTE